MDVCINARRKKIFLWNVKFAWEHIRQATPLNIPTLIWSMSAIGLAGLLLICLISNISSKYQISCQNMSEVTNIMSWRICELPPPLTSLMIGSTRFSPWRRPNAKTNISEKYQDTNIVDKYQIYKLYDRQHKILTYEWAG